MSKHSVSAYKPEPQPRLHNAFILVVLASGIFLVASRNLPYFYVSLAGLAGLATEDTGCAYESGFLPPVF